MKLYSILHNFKLASARNPKEVLHDIVNGRSSLV
jgi:hypothetical protein